MPDGILWDAISVQADADSARGLGDAQVAFYSSLGHARAFVLIWICRLVVPPVAAEHDGEFGTWSAGGGGILACGWGGFGVEDDTEGALGVLRQGDGAGEEITEAVDGKEIGGWVEEVYDHDGDGGGKFEGGNVGELGKVDRGDGGDYMGEVFFALASIMSVAFMRDEDLVCGLRNH